MKKKKEEKEPKMIFNWNISELERLLDAIRHFRHQEECFCDLTDIEIEIYDNGDIFLNAEFTTNIRERFI